MTHDILHQLTNISADELRPIVHQILDTDAVPSGSVSAAKIGRSAGAATAGIYQVTGQAKTSAGERPWSAVVKVIGNPETRPQKVDEVAAQRELAVYHSGILASHQGGVCSPRCYAIQERNDLNLIWLQDLSAAPQPPWIPEYFIQTARHFGQFNAHWPEQALPAWDWLSKGYVHEKYHSQRHQKIFERLSDLQEHSLAGRALPSDVPQELHQLWEVSDELFSKVEKTSKGVCHGDSHPKNLFPMPDDGAGTFTVAVDWAHVGIESLGSDIGLLLASPVKWMELTFDGAAALVEPLFDAYVTGLAEAGWSGNEDQVRFTYLTCFMSEAIRITELTAVTVNYPSSHAMFEERWMRPIEQILDHWGEAQRFFLAYKEQTLQLARRL